MSDVLGAPPSAREFVSDVLRAPTSARVCIGCTEGTSVSESLCRMY